MDSKSLEVLEFPQVREILAGFTSFSASRTLALNLQPLTDCEKVSLLLQQSAEARRFLSLEPDFPIGGVQDIRDEVRMAAREKVLDPPVLIDIQQTLEAMRQLHGRLQRSSGEFPLLWDIASGITEFRQIEKDIANCITMSGEVLDSASDRLASVRQQIKSVREQLLERLKTTLNSPRGRKITQEPIITMREGRYVIPVKIEFRREIRGIVHDLSNTGATVFIEPWTTVELGNTFRELIEGEKREVEKVLAGLSAEVGSQEMEICQSIALTAELDLLMAKAKFAQKMKASEPTLVNFSDRAKEDGTLRLTEARHPLLGQKAVPLSVEMGRDFSILVITGPNTGGKTVALKTIGLLSIMAQAGIPIPAAPESQIPVFDGVFADIGDEQSIEQTLSSFSWHIGNIIRIINSATNRSLVLLDELGTNTDPVEGSALARSILLHFLNRGTMAVATTHYNDLKAFAHATPGLQNASLDFDPVTLMPTYQLRVGIPGGSNALATASRLGLSSEIISTARGMLSKGTQELEALLANLMEESGKIEAIRNELTVKTREAERRSAELENELQRLKTEERRILQETRDRVVREAAELQQEVRQALSELRKERKKESIEKGRAVVASVTERLKSETWQEKKGMGAEAAEEGKIKPGDTVIIRDANLQATVLALSEETGQIEVQAGRTKFNLGLDSVEKIASPSGTQTSTEPVRMVRQEKRTVSRELDLRGKRLDEVEPSLDSFLNDASLANLSEVRIIHGFGTGVVRQAVRDILASHPLVKSFRSGKPDEGGDGATIARL